MLAKTLLFVRCKCAMLLGSLSAMTTHKTKLRNRRDIKLFNMQQKRV